MFDLFAMVDLLIDGDNNWLYEMNQKLHSSTAYNYFQMGASALAVFTGGMRQTMTCFVAGTMILTAAGLWLLLNRSKPVTGSFRPIPEPLKQQKRVFWKLMCARLTN